MNKQKLIVTVLLLTLSFTAAAFAQPKRARGKVITTGEDRVVIQTKTGSQMTLEAGTVKRGNKYVKNRGQIWFIGQLKEDDLIEAEYGRDHGGHFFIRSIALVAKGKVITTGEDRVVIQSDKGGQMTLEVANVRHQGKITKHQGQMRFISLLKEGDGIEAAYTLGDGGHYIIARYYGSLVGVLKGKVITTGEDRVVVQSDNGGQITLEANWVKKGNRWGRNEKQIKFFQTLDTDDRMEAEWVLDEGTHYVVRSIAKVSSDGKRVTPEDVHKH